MPAEADSWFEGKMMKAGRRPLSIVMALVLAGMSVLTFRVHEAEASGTIYIMADGSIDPATAAIQRDGDVYTFTGNIYETISVERDNIAIDGNGYTLQDQTGQDDGFSLNDVSGVTIINTNILGFDDGIDIIRSSDNTIGGNNIANNYNGIHMHFFCNGNTIRNNNISDNENCGITIYGDSAENIVYHNNFVNNNLQASTQNAYSGTWYKDTEGNFWSDYTGIDSSGDGIGDTSYMIEGGSQDGYPLMNPWIIVEESPEEEDSEDQNGDILEGSLLYGLIIAAIVIVATVVFLIVRRRR